MCTEGVLYIATDIEYYDQAKYSAKTLSDSNNVNIGIVTTEDIHDKNRNCDIFDEIIETQEVFNDLRDKAFNIGKTPFERTLYVDCDTIFLGDISPVFDLLEQVDFAAAQAPAKHITINNVPEVFPEFNGGVIAYKKSDEVDEFIHRWEQIYRRQIQQGRPNETIITPGRNKLEEIDFGRYHDQPPLREALYKSDIDISVLPSEYNFRGAGCYVYDTVKILHIGHTTEATKIRSVINEKLGPRARLAWRGRLYRQRGTSVPLPSSSASIIKAIGTHPKIQSLLEALGIKDSAKKTFQKYILKRNPELGNRHISNEDE